MTAARLREQANQMARSAETSMTFAIAEAIVGQRASPEEYVLTMKAPPGQREPGD